MSERPMPPIQPTLFERGVFDFEADDYVKRPETNIKEFPSAVSRDIKRAFEEASRNGPIIETIHNSRVQPGRLSRAERIALTAIIGLPLAWFGGNLIWSNLHPEKFTTQPPAESTPFPPKK